MQPSHSNAGDALAHTGALKPARVGEKKRSEGDDYKVTSLAELGQFFFRCDAASNGSQLNLAIDGTQRLTGGDYFATPDIALGIEGLAGEVTAGNTIFINQREMTNAKLCEQKGDPGTCAAHAQNRDPCVTQALLLVKT